MLSRLPRAKYSRRYEETKAAKVLFIALNLDAHSLIVYVPVRRSEKKVTLGFRAVRRLKHGEHGSVHYAWT